MTLNVVSGVELSLYNSGAEVSLKEAYFSLSHFVQDEYEMGDFWDFDLAKNHFLLTKLMGKDNIL